MPMRSGLAVYLYTAPTNQNFAPPAVVEIGSLLTDLSFASAAPGGFTTLSATLPVRDARIPLPEFALFSLIAVMNGPDPVWLGEIVDPEMGMDATTGEYIRINALGLGNALRDFPNTIADTAKTAKQIVTGPLSDWTVFTSALQTISTDMQYIFPDNPAGTYSPTYDNRSIEEIIADVCTLAGDYQWGTWAHPLASQTNAAGFRLGVVSVQLRDPNTTHYSASILDRDVIAYDVAPSADRAYNAISVDYSTSTGVVEAFALDPRLDVSYAQKNAPFRYRGLVRDYSGVPTITATIANQLASQYMNLYKDISNKISMTLRRIHDANGNLIPLWEAQADRNIFIRDFATRASVMYKPLPNAPTATVNQFYIVNAEYREDNNGTQQLDLQCDNFVDQTATQIARLTLAADVKSRTSKTTGVVQALGAPASGRCSMSETNASGGQTLWANIQYPNGLYQSPTSIAFSAVSVINLGSPTAANINTLGAVAASIVSAGGNARGTWTYTTSGNCIRRIGRKYLDWHCDGCGKELKGLAISRFVRVETAWGEKPGEVGLAIDCPECAGFTESFNTGLTSADESGEHPGRRRVRHAHRMEQARFIRQLMRHGAVGLEVLP